MAVAKAHLPEQQVGCINTTRGSLPSAWDTGGGDTLTNANGHAQGVGLRKTAPGAGGRRK